MAGVALAVHTFLLLLVYIGWVSSSWDIERDMIWLWMVFVDCPIFFAYIRFVDGASGHLFALTSFLIGGAQWALIGACLDLLRRYPARMSPLRRQP